jgi:FkbM family methyltransferase
MRALKAKIRTVAHRLGYDILRYPREDQLIQQWIGRLRNGGPVECAFDVGANCAQTVAPFRSWFPSCSIYAFEPAETAYRDLVAATRNNLRLWPIRAALGERDGTAKLHENAVDVTNSLLPNSSRTDEFAPGDMCAPVAESTVPLPRLQIVRVRRDCLRSPTRLEVGGRDVSPGQARAVRRYTHHRTST